MQETPTGRRKIIPTGNELDISPMSPDSPTTPERFLHQKLKNEDEDENKHKTIGLKLKNSYSKNKLYLTTLG